MTTLPPTQRIQELDVAKGLMILIVPFYHIVYLVDPFMYGLEVLGCLMLGCFFFLIGYNYRAGRRTLKQRWSRRTKNLLIPALGWYALISVIASCWFYFGEGESLWYVFDSVMMGLFRPELLGMLFPGVFEFTTMYNCLSPVWFVWTCYLASLLMLLVVEWCVYSWSATVKGCFVLGLASALMIQAGLLLPWNLQCVPFYAALMLFAARLRHSRTEYFHGRLVPRMARLPLFVGGLSLLALICLVAPTRYLYRGNLGDLGGLNVVTFFVGTIIASMLFLELVCSLRRRNVSPRSLAWLGRNTLPILILHGPLGVIFSTLLDSPAKFATANWSMDAWPWCVMTPEIFFASVASYLITTATVIAVILAWNKLKALATSR